MLVNSSLHIFITTRAYIVACVCLAAAAADCPPGCDKCQLDANSIITCTSTGCSGGFFYALTGQCVGQLQRRVCVWSVTCVIIQHINRGRDQRELTYMSKVRGK